MQEHLAVIVGDRKRQLGFVIVSVAVGLVSFLFVVMAFRLQPVAFQKLLKLLDGA